MQKHLRIDYRLSFWPIVAVLFLALVCTGAVFLLHLNYILYMLFIAALLVLSVWQLHSFLQKPQSLHFDGKLWSVFEGGQKSVVELLPESFSSRFFMVLKFRSNVDKKRFCFCFARDNCAEADFRALRRQFLQ